MAYSDPLRALEYGNQWRNRKYAADPDYRSKVLAANKQYRTKNAAKIALNDCDKQRLRITGWTRAEYDAAMQRQGGACAICGKKPGEKTPLHADHCHNSGKKRELLCFPCNTWLGGYERNPGLMAARVAYLEKHK